MGELSVHMCEEFITFADGGELLGKLKKTSIHPRGLEAFVKVSYEMQGTVAYQTFLKGVVAGASLAFGPPGEPRTDLEEGSPTDPILHSTAELTGDGTGEAAPPAADDLALFVDAHPHKFAPGGEFSPDPAVSETIVPSAESIAAVGETIAPVSESPAAVASPEASGAVSP